MKVPGINYGNGNSITLSLKTIVKMDINILMSYNHLNALGIFEAWT